MPLRIQEIEPKPEIESGPALGSELEEETEFVNEEEKDDDPIDGSL